MNPLIVDTDGGVDDAQALMMLIAGGRPPMAITTLFGNVSLQQATDNVLATLAIARADIPVHMGADKPLKQATVDARQIHGEDGLGGVARPDVTARPASDDAIGFLVETLVKAAASDEKVDLLMIGPMTNLARAIAIDPVIIQGLGQLTIMGGTLHGRGNTTPAAEFNVFADPEAAKIVFAARIRTIMVPWEPCMHHKITGPAYEACMADLPDTPQKRFMTGLAAHARTVTQGYGHPDVFRFVDPFAAAVALDPSIVTSSIEASVDVSLAEGITRGMTVVDPTGRLGTPPVTLVETGDVEAMTKMLVAAVGYDPVAKCPLWNEGAAKPFLGATA